MAGKSNGETRRSASVDSRAVAPGPEFSTDADVLVPSDGLVFNNSRQVRTGLRCEGSGGAPSVSGPSTSVVQAVANVHDQPIPDIRPNTLYTLVDSDEAGTQPIAYVSRTGGQYTICANYGGAAEVFNTSKDKYIRLALKLRKIPSDKRTIPAYDRAFGVVRGDESDSRSDSSVHEDASDGLGEDCDGTDGLSHLGLEVSTGEASTADSRQGRRPTRRGPKSKGRHREVLPQVRDQH
uniref:Uncharacterized protein n=1 Tax=Riboviria sp. TaxID=2585031 RepID=A0A8K1U4F2_9VIRU|nr:MAG: hypothetical protein 2 [Riboviria sp.]